MNTTRWYGHVVTGNVDGSIFTNMYILTSLTPLTIFSICLLRLGRKPVLVGSYMALFISMLIVATVGRMEGGE